MRRSPADAAHRSPPRAVGEVLSEQFKTTTARHEIGSRGECFYGSVEAKHQFADLPRRGDLHLLVVRNHAGRALLQRVRQSPASCSGGLLHFFRGAEKVEYQYGATGARFLRTQPEAASSSLCARPDKRAGVEPGTEFAAE